MSTQVILLERIETLGKMGDIVKVRPGYARNYLLPQKKALRASKENIAYYEAQKTRLEAENDKAKKEAEKRAKNITGVTLLIIRQASEAGQLFGSVAARDIAEQILAQTKEKIERSMVQINQNFKQIGLFPVSILLHPEVKIEVMINIARSVEEAEIQAKTGKALIASEGDNVAQANDADEEQMKNLLDESALEAQKEKKQAKAQEDQEEAEAESERAAKKAKKATKKAAKAEEEQPEEPEAGEAEED